MKRTRLQAALAVAFFVLATLTAIWPKWLEALGVDPDHGNGSAEWAIVALLALLALWSGGLATRNLHRFRTRAHAET